MALLACSLSGCSFKQPNPAAVYRSIQADFRRGALDVALARTERARADLANTDRTNADWPMQFRLLQADILTYQGRRKEVITLLTTQDVDYPVAGDAAIKRNLLLGFAHYGVGQSDLSAQELRTARDLARISHSDLLGEVLRTDGVVSLNNDQPDAALELFKESLELARSHDDAFLEATDLLNIGVVTSHAGRYDAAVPLLSDAAKFAQRVPAQTVLQAALGNLGEVYLRLGDFEKALDNYQRAERLAEEIGATRNRLDWVQWVGLSFYKLGNLDQARKHYERALALAMSLQDHDDIAEIDAELAILSFRQGRYDAAAAYSEAAIRAARESGDPSAALEPRFLQAMLAARQDRFEEAERMLMAIHDETVDGQANLRWDIENTLANLYAAAREMEPAQSWYRRSIDTFEAKRASVSDESLKLSFFANGDSLYRDYAAFLVETGKPREALQLLDRGRARTLEEGLAVNDKELRDALGKAVEPEMAARKLDACILFYVLGPERSFLWAITAQRTEVFTLPKQADIEALITQYQRAVLRSSDPLREGNAAASTLYDTLVAPAATMVPTGSRVFLIRDGALNGLNFEMLLAPSDAGLHYWIESVTIANASSILLLAGRTASASPAAKNLLMIGDPISSGPRYEKLANAAAEIDDVQKHFPIGRSTVLTNAAAIPATYSASKPDQFSYIHFVAHGIGSVLSPLDSAVVLSPPADDPENFKLYARDILNYPLHAQLVTISSCYGSGLRTYAGEGMVGLAWAFLRAGSHEVIAALWEVNDASTSIFMDRLYAQIERGRAADASLRAAKLSFIHSSGVYRKPLYWAAFQLYTGS